MSKPECIPKYKCALQTTTINALKITGQVINYLFNLEAGLISAIINNIKIMVQTISMFYDVLKASVLPALSLFHHSSSSPG